MSEANITLKLKANKDIDWENLDMDGNKMCSILNGPNCESCEG